MAESFKISIELADQAAQRSLSDFLEKGSKLDQSFKKIGDTGNSSFGSINLSVGKALSTFQVFAANVAADLAVRALGALKDAASSAFQVFIVDGVKAAEESEAALRALNVSLAQAGNYSDGASNSIKAFAEEIQRTTAFEDDAVIKNAALLESLTRLDAEGLKRATKAAVELSSAFGIDLETATRAVGKASEGNVTALKKLGLEFETTGTKSGTFNNALAAIERQLGGNAEANVKTFAGSITQAKNSFQDLQEEIGALITSNPALTAAISRVTQLFQESKDAVQGNQAAFQQIVGEGFLKIIDGAIAVTKVLDVFVSAFRIAYNLIEEATVGLAAVVTRVFGFFSDDMKAFSDELVVVATEARDSVDKTFSEGSLGGAVDALQSVRDAASEGFSKITEGANNAAPAIQNAKKALGELTEEQIRAAKENDNFTIELAKRNDSIKESYETQIADLENFRSQQATTDSEYDEVNYQLKLDRENEYYVARQELLEQNAQAETLRVQASTVSEETKAKALNEIQSKQQGESQKLALTHEQNLKKISDLRVANQRDTFSTIATLSSSNNQSLAAIGKAAGVTQIAIDTPVAISKALSAFPPPFNFAAAALVGVAMAAQAAQIAGINFAQGGIVPGTSLSGDLVQANLNSKEMVLNQNQQANLFAMANGRSSGSSDGRIEQLTATVSQLTNTVAQLANQPMSIQVDGREIINVTRTELARGRTI